MPITQDRFMQVVNASATIIDMVRDLAKLVRPSYTSAIINANTALDSPDPAAKDAALRECIAFVQRINSSITDSGALSSDHAVAILAEREWFRRNATRNEKAAISQRKSRVRKGTTPHLWQQGFVHKGVPAEAAPPTAEVANTAQHEMGAPPPDIMEHPALRKHHEKMIASWAQSEPTTTTSNGVNDIWTKTSET